MQSVGIGTKVPAFRLHVVSSPDDVPAQFEISNSNAANINLYNSHAIDQFDTTGIDFIHNAYGGDDITAQIQEQVTDNGLDSVSSQLIFRTRTVDEISDTMSLKGGNTFIGNNTDFAYLTGQVGGLKVKDGAEIGGNLYIGAKQTDPSSLNFSDYSGGIATISFDSASNGFSFDASGGSDIKNILLNPNSGNVGIFKSNPTYKLDIIGDERISTTMVNADGSIVDDGFGNITGTGTFFTTQLKQGYRIFAPSVGEYTEVISIADDEHMFVYPPTSYADNDFQYAKNPIEVYADDDTPIFQEGAVGTFHVGKDGGANTRNSIIFRNGGYEDPVPNGETNAHYVSAGDKIILFNNDADFKTAIGISDPGTGGGMALSAGGSNYANLRFFTCTGNACTPAERMRIAYNGNVGIGTGTAVPASMLSVVGNASFGSSFGNIAAPANGLIVQGNTGIGTSTPVARLDVYGAAGAADVFRVSSSTNARMLTLNAAGNFGIGTTTPIAKLHISDGNSVASSLYTSDYEVISAQGTAPGFNIISADSAASSRGVFKATRSRGTLASPTAVALNDQTFSLLGAAFDGTVQRATAGISYFVDGTVTNNTQAPQAIVFETGTSSRAEVARITSGGRLGIATTTPDSTLDVNGSFRLEGASAFTTASISGAIVGTGCDTADTTGLTGLASSTAYVTTPQTFPGNSVFFYTMTLTSTSARTYVCSAVTVTPTASTYNVRIIK